MQAVLSIYGLKQLVNERNATYNDLFFTSICFCFLQRHQVMRRILVTLLVNINIDHLDLIVVRAIIHVHTECCLCSSL